MISEAPFRLGARARAQNGCCSEAGHCSELKNIHKQQGKGLDYREIGNKFGFGALSACRKPNTACTDENFFRLVPGHGALVLPLDQN